MLEIGILLILLSANAFLALAELSVVSSNRSRLQLMADRHVRGAASALGLSEHQDDFLSAVQVGITLVGILSGVYGGATFSSRLSALLQDLPVIGPHSEAIAYGLIVALLTYLSVILGELVPKQLALASPERFACFVAPPMRIFVKVATPVIWVLSTSSELVLRLMGRRPNQSPAITEEDVNMMMTEAFKSGAIHEDEQDIAQRALRLADRPATSIMTPRVQVTWIHLDCSPQELRETLLSGEYSRYPVCRRSADNVVGVLLQREAIRHLVEVGFSTDARTRQQQLERLLHPPIVIPGSATAADVLETFKREKTHFAIVSDEFGGMEGVLSNHDLLEALVGHLAGTQDEPDAINMRGDGSLLVSGWVTLDEVFRALELPIPVEVSSTSIAALLFQSLGRLPDIGESMIAFGLRFEVMDKDGTIVDRVLVSRTVIGADSALPESEEDLS